MQIKIYNSIFLCVIFSIISIKFVFGNESYFDLSDEKIEIQTNFNGKEVIIFGLIDSKFDTIIAIKGPKKNTSLRKKEQLFGFWFNTKKIIYKDLPNIFFIASSSPVKEILNIETIIKKSLHFDEIIHKIITQRNFNFTENNKFNLWNKNLIQLKQNLKLYKEYDLKIVEEKLFQTKIFFPTNTVPGTYDVNIYKIKDKIIVSEKNKKIIIKRTGIGNKIYEFANKEPATYGIICILLAVFAGLFAATAFRRL